MSVPRDAPILYLSVLDYPSPGTGSSAGSRRGWRHEVVVPAVGHPQSAA